MIARARSGWTRKPLGEVADVISGYAFKSGEFGDSGIPVIKIKNIRVGLVDLTGADRVDEKFLSIPERYHVRAGDILISLTGSHISQPNSVVGRVARHSTGLPDCLLNQRAGKVIIRDRNACDLSFLFYALSESETVRAIAMKAHGAANQANVSPTQVESVEIPLPPPPVQRRIAGILSAHDELIANCQRRIQLLEAMARALYREWFVNFRFPGHEKHPRIASPLGDIPQGWEVKKLSELCSRMESGGTPRRNTPEYWEGGTIDWFKTGELWDGFLFESEEKITERGFCRVFSPGTIMMAIYGSPTVGRLGITTRPSSCNQAALGLVADTTYITQSFLYFVLFSLRDHFNGLAQGAAQQNISKEKVATALAVVPPRQLVTDFARLVDPIFDQIQALQRQIQNLRRTRDLLLPRLLSGQVELKTQAA